MRRSFAGIQAVDGLDLDIPRGTIVGMIGPNGCGKTTSINCITGFDREFTGEVAVEGRSIVGLTPDAVARAGVMRTFQAVRVFDEFSVLENAVMGLQCFDGLAWWEPVLRTKPFRAAESLAVERATALLETVRLGTKLHQRAGELSYGQKKLLALACVLMSRPSLVILDEPVAGVNPTGVNEIADILAALNEDGTTFLIIEHNIGFVMRLSHTVMVIDRGKRLTAGSPAEIRQDERVLEAYLGGHEPA
jgi:branched-chain amino acid transport system ATP-binding protein